MKTTILSVHDIRTIVRHMGLDQLMDTAITRLQVACRDYEQNRFQIPVRDGFEYALPQMGLLEWMPVMKTGSCATLKVVGYHPLNPDEKDLPTILSVVLTFDTASGHLIGVVDGTFPTAVRTGAASAVASHVLAHPDSRTLGLVGAGAQAITQLHALSRTFDLREVLVYDTDSATSQSFEARTAHLDLGNLKIKVASLRDVICSADILCTATSVDVGKGPVFDDDQLQPHVHINAVGSDFPGKTELPTSLLRRALVCPDFPVQALKEGECQQLDPEELGPDLIELTREPDIFAEYRAKPTVFDSTGWALEDHVMMDILIEQARKLNCGTAVQIEGIGLDPKSPYGFLDHGAVDDGKDENGDGHPCQLYAID